MNATTIETREKRWTYKASGRYSCPDHDVQRSIRAERYTANFYGRDREYLRVTYRINHVIDNATDAPFDKPSSQTIWASLDGFTI